MNDWTKINLKWFDNGAYDVSTAPKKPNLDDETKKEFGLTEDEAFQKFYFEQKDEKQLDEYEKNVQNWLNKQPLYIEYEKKYNEWCLEQDKIAKNTKTFCGEKLNKPGTLIKTEDDKIYLIGDINSAGGVCDDCMGFGSGTIIKEYKIVYEQESN